MTRIPLAACLVTSLLWVGACSPQATPGETRTTPSQHVATALAAPQSASRQGARPDWPTTASAERHFSTERMFIETLDRGWHAWLVAAPVGGRVRAMDFFSGETIEGTVAISNTDPHQYTLTEASGQQHRWLADASFQTSSPQESNGAKYFGNADAALDFSETIFANDPQGMCPLELHVVARVLDENTSATPPSWAKIAMYRAAPDSDCPGGEWISDMRSALDLQDGTLLAAIGDRVFRLSMADLSPVGQAPTLRIIDASRANAIAKRIATDNIEDPNGYLTRSLQSDAN